MKNIIIIIGTILLGIVIVNTMVLGTEGNTLRMAAKDVVDAGTKEITSTFNSAIDVQ